jgi:hypothetical protein
MFDGANLLIWSSLNVSVTKSHGVLIYSFSVCEKVESKGRTTYNEVSTIFSMLAIPSLI